MEQFIELLNLFMLIVFFAGALFGVIVFKLLNRLFQHPKETPKVGKHKESKEDYDSVKQSLFYCCLCDTSDESKCICPYK
jgi:hypothetical protein